MELVTGLHHKSLLRLPHAPNLELRPHARHRGRAYGAEVKRVALTVWTSLDLICAKRLTPPLVETSRYLALFGVLTRSVAGE